jgi:hypothetical protein
MTKLGAPYWRLWMANAVSSVGDGAFVTALPLLAVTVRGGRGRAVRDRCGVLRRIGGAARDAAPVPQASHDTGRDP